MSTLSAIAESEAPRLRVLGAALRNLVSFPVLLAVLLVGGVMLGTSLTGARGDTLFGEGDTWWHAKTGELILRTGQLPHADPFSFTVPGTDWLAYEWLGEVAMAGAQRLGGLSGLKLLDLFLAGSLSVLLYLFAAIRCGNCKAAFAACAIVLPVTVIFFTLRPQLIGYIFFVLTLICLEQFRRGHVRALWYLPPLFLLWVNVHGTFVFGLLAIGLCWVAGLKRFEKGGLVAERWSALDRRRLLVILLLCVLVLPLTPYGTRLAGNPLVMGTLQPANITNIQEWQPLGFGHLLGKVLLLLLLVFFLTQLIYRLTFRLEEVLLFLFVTYAACVHLRFGLLFLLVFTPMLANILARWIRAYDPNRDRWVLNGVLIAAVSLAAVRYFPTREQLQLSFDKAFPSAAMQYIQNHPPPGPMLNAYGWGGYLIWLDSPRVKVFIDGRADIYEYAGVLQDYLRITRPDPEALALLRVYGVRACLIEPRAPLATLLNTLPQQWQLVYSNDRSALYYRRPSLVSNGPVPSATQKSVVPAQ